MKQINRRVDAMACVQEAIVVLGGIIKADDHTEEVIRTLQEVRKELAYEIFRADIPPKRVSDEEKTMRCGDAGFAVTPDTYPTTCIVDGKEYTDCYDCPLCVG